SAACAPPTSTSTSSVLTVLALFNATPRRHVRARCRGAWRHRARVDADATPSIASAPEPSAQLRTLLPRIPIPAISSPARRPQSSVPAPSAVHRRVVRRSFRSSTAKYARRSPCERRGSLGPSWTHAVLEPLHSQHGSDAPRTERGRTSTPKVRDTTPSATPYNPCTAASRRPTLHKLPIGCAVRTRQRTA
ncbi:hypothetical protein DICSQDRAFT_157417, partial [Dichomitus squalens LYAD-421 SS1]